MPTNEILTLTILDIVSIVMASKLYQNVKHWQDMVIEAKLMRVAQNASAFTCGCKQFHRHGNIIREWVVICIHIRIIIIIIISSTTAALEAVGWRQRVTAGADQRGSFLHRVLQKILNVTRRLSSLHRLFTIISLCELVSAIFLLSSFLRLLPPFPPPLILNSLAC